MLSRTFDVGALLARLSLISRQSLETPLRGKDSPVTPSFGDIPGDPLNWPLRSESRAIMRAGAVKYGLVLRRGLAESEGLK